MFLAKKLNKGSGTPVVLDAQFNYVTMLLHGDGTNGAQNNTFLDSSSNTFSITRNGNTTQGSFSPYGDKWSNHFDGTGDYLSTPNVAALQPGTSTNPFCVECWVFPTSTPASDIAILGNFKVTSYPTNTDGFDILQSSSNQVALRWGYPNYADSGVSAAMTLNTWNHIAVCRNSSGSMSCYLNGTRWFNTSTNTSITNATASSFWVGWAGSLSGTTINPFAGYISNVRLVKGSTPYDPTSSTLTVPTAPLTAITNTSLLTCQSNRFIDSNASPKTITANGDTSVQRFNPFGTSTAYSTSVIGGSGYFDGTGDYLTAADNSAFAFGTGNFTAECWFNVSSNTNYRALIDTRNGVSSSTGWIMGVQGDGTIYIYSNAFIVNSAAGAIKPLAWYHAAYVFYDSTHTLYLNGVAVSTSTTSRNYTDNKLAIGGASWSAGEYWAGYVSDARLVKGTAVYTAAFTPPTAPLTNITNTSILTKFQNAAIFDNAMMNDLETVGNAQISTSVKKYGTGSLSFDGTGDGLYRPPTPNLDFGTGNFTIEWWMYFSSKSGYQTIMSYGYTPETSTGWLIQTGNGDGKIVFYKQTGGTTIASDTGSTVNTGEWYHMAVVRNSGTTTIYRNGTSVGSGSDTNNYVAPTAKFYLGGGSSTAFDNYFFNGYIDDLRITKGYARYTANFTAPTAAFLDTGPN